MSDERSLPGGVDPWEFDDWTTVAAGGVEPWDVEWMRTDAIVKSYYIKRVIESDKIEDLIGFLCAEFRISHGEARRLACGYGAAYGPMLLEFWHELHEPLHDQRKERTFERIAEARARAANLRRELRAEIESRQGDGPDGAHVACPDLMAQARAVAAFEKALAALSDPEDPPLGPAGSTAGGPSRAGATAEDSIAVDDQLVTLNQAAGMVNRSKRTLDRYKTRGRLPAPAVEGGGGKPHLYSWPALRPRLEQEFGRKLPETFPASYLR